MLLPAIRPIALAAVRRRDDVLVFECVDPSRNHRFYRPLGGGIDFGERAEDALRREMIEELGVELANVALLGVLENIFHGFSGMAHEIAFVFTADLADPEMYQRDAVGVIADNGDPVSWQPLATFRAGVVPLYPDGLLALLDS